MFVIVVIPVLLLVIKITNVTDFKILTEHFPDIFVDMFKIFTYV